MPTHVVSGRSAGLTDTHIAHLLDEPLPDDVFDDRERAVVRYARASTRLDPIDDGLYGELATWFDPPALIELCLIVGSANLVNRFHRTFLTPLD